MRTSQIILQRHTPLILALLLPCLILAGRANAQSPSPSPSASASPPHPQPQRDPFIKTPSPIPGSQPSQPVKVQSLLFTVEVYAMAQDDAAPLMELSGSGVARHDAVLALMHAGKARLETLLCCGDLSGQRSVVECIDELRYGTNYSTRSAGQVPTEFETRNVGDTVEFETTLDNSNHCELNFVLQRTRLLAFDPVFAHLPTKVVQARFQSAKITTAMTLDIGQMEFLGTLSRPPTFASPGSNAPDQEVRLAFGKIDRLDTGEYPPDAPVQRPNPPSPTNIEVTLAYYSMDREAARQILSIGGTGIYQAVKDLADKNEAKLERSTVLKTESGQRALVMESEEVRYPTQSASPSEPTAFETRNAGLQLEGEPTIAPGGKTVSINIVPALVLYLGDLQGDSQPVVQPLFETRKITTSIKAATGKYALLGTASDPGDDGIDGRKDTGRTWLCFVRASTP